MPEQAPNQEIQVQITPKPHMKTPHAEPVETFGIAFIIAFQLVANLFQRKQG